MAKIFGGAGGGVAWLDTDTTGYSYITISGSSIESFLTGRAPATDIQINTSADYSINKTLKGDFLVSSFGLRPVDISIDGFDIYTAQGCSELSTKERVQVFWSTYNVHADKDARVTVSINNLVYRCVLLAMESGYSSSAQDTAGIGTYKLNFIGVDVSAG